MLLMIAIVVLVPAVVAGYRCLDLLSIDEYTPRVLGVRPGPARLMLLTGTAVAAIGLVAFVGLVAPHAARSLVGWRHLRVIPVAALLGAILLVLADRGRADAAACGSPCRARGAPYFFCSCAIVAESPASAEFVETSDNPQREPVQLRRRPRSVVL